MAADNPAAASSGGCHTLCLVLLLPEPCVEDHFKCKAEALLWHEPNQMRQPRAWPQKVSRWYTPSADLRTSGQGATEKCNETGPANTVDRGRRNSVGRSGAGRARRDAAHDLHLTGPAMRRQCHLFRP